MGGAGVVGAKPGGVVAAVLAGGMVDVDTFAAVANSPDPKLCWFGVSCATGNEGSVALGVRNRPLTECSVRGRDS